MSKPTGPTNTVLQGLIEELKKKSFEHKVNIWKQIALGLSKPTRRRATVNLSKINRYTKENEIVIIPGKVLGSGDLDHKVTISAYQFSDGAEEKISKAGAKIIPLADIIKESPKGKAIRIMI